MTLRTTAKAVNLRWNRPRQGHDVALQGMGLVGAVDNRVDTDLVQSRFA